jgi:hypothetical protein
VSIGPGDTFLLTRRTGTTPHLWVILWGPAGAARAFLAVYLTTLRAHSDRSCVIVRGEHPFIQHDTAVAYGKRSAGRKIGCWSWSATASRSPGSP